MITEFIKTEDLSREETLVRIGETLRNDGIVAIPTETVYGLAANALSDEAVKKIFTAKGRPQDNPLIVHIGELDELYPLVSEVPEKALMLAQKFWPGPLTIILKKSDAVCESVSAGLDTVAVRMPSHPVARAIIKASGVPLAAPSANVSGKPSPTTAEHVLHDMNGRIDMIVDGGESAVGVESTVITLCTEKPRLLRPGGITLEQLRSVIGEVELDNAVFNELQKNEKPSSPGMKYKHYSPDADVLIVRGDLSGLVKLAESCDKDRTAVFCFDGEEASFPNKTYSLGDRNDPVEHAHRIFDLLRKADEENFTKILVHCPPKDGVGMAVMNRLLRAAAFNVIEV
ncbi:MAG: threonylcarbamoyl-AMP synthase [Clostridia bacterium]|nr:threonylcarbamoyl-AMP synthase [Clostridia bacterium]